MPAAIPAIAILLLAGLALRLIIAYVFFPASGFKTDTGTFTSWALSMAHYGPGGFYANAGFSDYPPGYLYVLWVVGAAANALATLVGGGTITLAGVTLGTPTLFAGALIKLPAIAADLAIGYLLYRLVRRWLGERREAEGAALGAAALYVFNPVTWYDSALWGQVDSVGALVMLVAVVLLIDGFSEGAVAAAVLAGLIKPQFGVVLAPLILVLLLRRHLFLPGSGPRASLVPRMLRGWVADEQGPWRLVSSAVVGAATWLVLATPFSMSLPMYVQLVNNSAIYYHYLAMGAYNLWALVGQAGQTQWTVGMTPDDLHVFGPLSAFSIGAILLGTGFLVATVQLGLRDSRRSILLAVVFLSLAFFVLPTRVHERYLFPAFAFLPLLAVGSRSFKVTTLVLVLASFVNLHAVLTYPLYGTANVADLPFGEDFRSFWWVAAGAVTQTAVFVYVLWRLRPAVDVVVGPLRRLLGFPRRPPDEDPFDLPADGPPVGGPAPAGVPLPGPAPPAVWAALPAPAATSASRGPTTGDVAAATTVPAGIGTPRALLPDALARLGLPEWLMRRSLRRDRSGDLRREPSGRPDRLDLLVAVLLILAALTLRTWRLEEPYAKVTLDEVYHVRTATEFLQDWRYGEPHSIYEFTHPHLAKYLIAVGLVLFGDDRVTGQASLAGPVSDSVAEKRWSPTDQPAERDGDRLYTATSNGVRAYDLQDRGLVATIPLTGGRVPERLAIDPEAHLLYIADDAGGVWTLDSSLLDAVRRDPTGGPSVPSKLGELGGRASRLALSGDGSALVAILPGDRLVSLSTTDGSRTGQATDQGAADLAAVDGTNSSGRIAVADAAGVTLRDASTLGGPTVARLGAPATGLVLMRGLDQPTLYVTTADGLSWVTVPTTGDPVVGGPLAMPGPVRDVAWDDASNLLHVLGRTADGSTDTVYVVEPIGGANAVFADARLPFAASSWVLDTQADRPTQDRQQLLALDAAGQLAVVDIGHHAYGSRLIGVIAGALMAGLLYLMGRFLFRRRSVALLMGGLVLLDGMFFAQSRIAMNDTYVAFFIVAAYALFTPLYLGVWRGRLAVLLGLPAVGILLGLALASKWVGAYAIGGLVLLVLLRSALGRLIALAGMVGLTGALGWLAIGATSTDAPLGDATFLAIMVGLTMLLAAAIVLRPLRWTAEELRFAVALPAALGALVGLAAIVLGARLPAQGLLANRNLALLSAGLLAAALVVYAVFLFLARAGLGPLAPTQPAGAPPDGLEPPGDPPRQAWLVPGPGWGVPWLLGLLCLTVLPLVVYVVSYTPWVALGNQFWSGMPPGNTGQTLWDLTVSMYNYHNDLRAPHAASSPWWAWPFDLKPTWHWQQGFAEGTTAIVYGAGNVVLFWISVPVMAWAAWQAWSRRSLALTLVVVGFLCQWLSWSRIDRTTFQYHYFTALPFLALTVGYFLAELWHGPSPRTWLLARVGAAAALVGVPLMWLLRVPLCSLAGVAKVASGSQVCGYVSLPFVLTQRSAVVTAILLLGGGLLLWQVLLLSRQGHLEREHGIPGGGVQGGILWLVLTAGATLAALYLAVGRFGEQPFLTVPIGTSGPYVFGLVTLVPLAALAYLVLRTRDPRRFAAGLLGAIALWFVIFYPDIAALPIPTGLKNLFQVLPLPTYAFDFQFAVNTAAARNLPVLGLESLALTAVTGVLAGAVMYAAWSWRLARAAAGAEPSDRARPPAGPRELDAPVA